MNTINNNNNGMRIFTIVWLGQFVSVIGTAMTRFALLIWAYDQTGSATTVALLGFFSFAAAIVVSPFAGVWIDRWDRRLVMLGADLGAGLMTIAMLVLYSLGLLEIWHLFAAELLTGAFESFQYPAYSAATTTLIPKEQYGRASGMRSLAESASQIIAPFLAGLLLVAIDINGVMAIDVVTFLVAVGTLLFVRFPTVQREAAVAEVAGDGTPPNIWQEIQVGLRYIVQRRGLLGVMLIFSGIDFFAALTYFSILPTLILARTGGDELALATVQAALGVGGVVGGLLLSVWGGPRRQIHAILAGTALSFLLGDLSFAVGRSLPAWVVGGFVTTFFIPFIVGANRVIWQSKVPPQMQGRVFAVQSTVHQALIPLGYLLAGPLADFVFEPAMAVGGSLAGSLGWLVGTGPGAGMGLMFVGTAVCGTLISLSGYLFRAVRNVEIELPDHDRLASVESEGTAELHSAAVSA